MIRAFEGIDGYQSADIVNTVRGYFIRQSLVDPEAVASLERDAGLSPSGTTRLDEAAWRRVQDAYRAGLVRRIRDAATPGKRVVFLVHGYRNDYDKSRPWYDFVRDDLTKNGLANNTVFVDVYWDGTNGFRVLNLWKKAQWNMADVGLELRRLVNGLPTSTPITFVTHSTGTPLVANILGDASAPFARYEKRREDDPYFKRAKGLDGAPHDGGTYAISPRRGVRFGAVAPAAATNTFVRYSFPGDIVPERISFALNRRDLPTSKLFMRCTFQGASCMAVDPVATCQALVGAFGTRGTNIGIYDFSTGIPRTARSGIFWRKHSVPAYAQNGKWRAFTAHLFGEEPVPASDTADLCSQPTTAT
jgi:hypothetical protein